MDMKRKTAIVTGASRGIGKQIAIESGASAPTSSWRLEPSSPTGAFRAAWGRP